MARIAGIAGAALALSASTASARPVVMWGCHGPLGQPLGTAFLTAEQTADGTASATFGCSAAEGLTASFTRGDPAGGSRAAWSATIPTATTLTSVRLTRTLTPALGASAAGVPQRYVARAGGTVLESVDLVSGLSIGTAPLAVAAGGITVSIGVECAQTNEARCQATTPGAVSVATLALEREAQPGPLGSLRVTNGSTRSVAVAVRLRPWIQARDGTVLANSRPRLAQVRLSATAFTLAPGAARTISATLAARPSRGSLYGAVEVIATPQGPRPSNAIRTRL